MPCSQSEQDLDAHTPPATNLQHALAGEGSSGADARRRFEQALAPGSYRVVHHGEEKSAVRHRSISTDFGLRRTRWRPILAARFPGGKLNRKLLSCDYVAGGGRYLAQSSKLPRA